MTLQAVAKEVQPLDRWDDGGILEELRRMMQDYGPVDGYAVVSLHGNEFVAATSPHFNHLKLIGALEALKQRILLEIAGKLVEGGPDAA